MVEKAGFWRRALAFAIDGLVVAIALELVAVVAFPLSNGHVQASLGIQTTNCRGLKEVPTAFEPPLGFDANFASECRVGLFGLPTAHTTTIGRMTQEGNVTKSAWVGFMVDEQGEPIRGLSLDILALPLLIAFRWWTDRHKGSPGRRVCRMVVADARDDVVFPVRAAITRRYIAFALPAVPAWLFTSYQATFPSFLTLESPLVVPLWIGTGLLAVIAVLWAIGQIVRREDTFYDRFAGTATRRRPS